MRFKLQARRWRFKRKNYASPVPYVGLAMGNNIISPYTNGRSYELHRFAY